jgi:multimeric flavodoxin WrbA
MYGHIVKLAEAEKKGIEAAGGKVDLYQYVSINQYYCWLSPAD